MLLDAPVSGSKDPAEQGALTIFASGPDERPPACRSPLRRARPAHDLGRRARDRNSAQAREQHVARVRERRRSPRRSPLLAGWGSTTETVVDALAGGPLVSPWQAAKLQRIAKDDFSAQFALSLALKDVRLALEAAGDGRFAALACLADEWQQAVDQGLGDQDLTVVTRALRAAGRDAMTLIGYTMMCEQAGPKQLVRDVALAEEAGFDFAVISDHYFPWLDSQGHSPYAWSVLGAAAQATDHIPLMTYVTCPIRRYHPAVVAQKAATMQLLSDGRFTLGLGRGREPERAHRRRTAGPSPVCATRCSKRRSRSSGPSGRATR